MQGNNDSFYVCISTTHLRPLHTILSRMANRACFLLYVYPYYTLCYCCYCCCSATKVIVSVYSVKAPCYTLFISCTLLSSTYSLSTYTYTYTYTYTTYYRVQRIVSVPVSVYSYFYSNYYELLLLSLFSFLL